MLDDLHELRSEARAALSRGDVDLALKTLLEAAGHAHVAEHEYSPIARMLGDALEKKGDARGALTARWCVAMNDATAWPLAQKLDAQVPPVDRARTLAAMGDNLTAAREMENAGLAASAAIYREKGTDWRGARALWSRLSHVGTGVHAGPADGAHAPGAPLSAPGEYIAALVQFNLGRCALACDDAHQARDAFVAAVRLLEEAADEFESTGLRERAFDCFQVLVEIGRASRQFEHVLEGYINCIRILREDHLKYYALQYYEEAVTAAKEVSEFSAAATIAREASEYARSLGMGAASAHYVLDQAELWRSTAKQHDERGAPPEIAENSLLAAILAFGQVGQFARVGALYRGLSLMDLEPSRKTHYARASHRYDGVRDEPLNAAPIPAHLRHDSHVVEVWHVDLVEWEQKGSASEACADVLLDKRWPDPLRRRAMLARLTALGVEEPTDAAPPAAGPSPLSTAARRVRLTEELAQLPLYAVLSPLEKLFARPEREVRLAVLAAMQSLHFKRSFVTVTAGLRDRDPAVVNQAARTLEDLVFPHAFDPLARVVRESANEQVRASALRAIARIDTPAAAEFLLGVIEHGAPVDRTAAITALKASTSKRVFLELARGAIRGASDDVRSVLREVV
ncbi:MAG: HEAT repeat domain-containing protein [Polyangiaceae bacterium]